MEMQTTPKARVTVAAIPPDVPDRSGPLVVGHCIGRGPIVFSGAVVTLFEAWDDDGDSVGSFGAAADTVSLWVPGEALVTTDDDGTWSGPVLPSHPVTAADAVLPDSWVVADRNGLGGRSAGPVDPAEALRSILDFDGTDAAAVDFVHRFGLLPEVDERLPMDPPELSVCPPVQMQLVGPGFRLSDALAGRHPGFDVQSVVVHDLAGQRWLLECYQRVARVVVAILADPELDLALRSWENHGTETPSYSTAIADVRIPRAVHTWGDGRQREQMASLNDLDHYLDARLLAPAGRPVSFTVGEPSSHPAVADHNVVLRRRLISDVGRRPPGPPGALDWEAETDLGRAWAAVCRHLLTLFRTRRQDCARCGTPFMVSREGKLYCTDACGNAARQARHRQRRRSV